MIHPQIAYQKTCKKSGLKLAWEVWLKRQDPCTDLVIGKDSSNDWPVVIERSRHVGYEDPVSSGETAVQ
jgi:hypothetical protein